MDLGDAPGQFDMLQPFPAVQAAGFQPGIQRPQIRKGRQVLPDMASGILHGLLDLPFLPSRCRIAEGRLEQIMAGQGHEAQVDLTCLARANPVHSGLHVVKNTPPWHATEHAEASASASKSISWVCRG